MRASSGCASPRRNVAPGTSWIAALIAGPYSSSPFERNCSLRFALLTTADCSGPPGGLLYLRHVLEKQPVLCYVPACPAVALGSRTSPYEQCPSPLTLESPSAIDATSCRSMRCSLKRSWKQDCARSRTTSSKAAAPFELGYYPGRSGCSRSTSRQVDPDHTRHPGR